MARRIIPGTALDRRVEPGKDAATLSTSRKLQLLSGVKFDWNWFSDYPTLRSSETLLRR
jgi:hypothetical protein